MCVCATYIGNVNTYIYLHGVCRYVCVCVYVCVCLCYLYTYIYIYIQVAIRKAVQKEKQIYTTCAKRGDKPEDYQAKFSNLMKTAKETKPRAEVLSLSNKETTPRRVFILSNMMKNSARDKPRMFFFFQKKESKPRTESFFFQIF